MLKKIWNWYYSRFISEGIDADRNVPLKELKWLPKNIYAGRHEPFGYIDSIQFDIGSILTRDEVILEVDSREKAKEVIEAYVHQI